MAEPRENPLSSLMFDVNTRLRELEERNRLLRERVLIVGKNMLSLRDDVEKELGEIKKENFQFKKDIEKLKIITQNILSEVSKFARKDEMNYIERMLADFQPLKFARMSDLKELEERITKKKAEKKSGKTNKN